MKGYVRKRGNKWSYTVDIGRDPETNKRKQKTKSGFATKKEATAAMNEVIYELNKGTFIQPKEIKMKEFALDWLVDRKHRWRDTTFDFYHSKIKTWVIPLLGEMKLQDLKPIHGQKYANKLLELSHPVTAKKTLAVTKQILNHAVTLELIPRNSFKDISILDEKKKVETWTFEELEHFLDVVKQKNRFYHNVFALAAYTGLRKGEVLGIARTNADFKNNKLVITQSIAESKEKGVHISKLKTPSSYRVIAMDSDIISILKEQIKINNEWKLKFGPEYKDHDLIFCYPDGMMLRPSGINDAFRRYIKKAGVPYIRFHDMRHTHATHMLELGVSAKVVADRLGHSSVKITLDTYSHPSAEIQANAVELLSKRKKSVRGQNVVKPKQETAESL